MHGVIDVMRVHDVFGIRTEDMKAHAGRALATVCLHALIAFTTETLPIQFSLDDSFVSLFSRSGEEERPSEDLTIENARATINDSPITLTKTQSVISNGPQTERLAEEEKAANPRSMRATSQDLETPPLVVEKSGSTSPSFGNPVQTKRPSLKEYLTVNVSIDAIRYVTLITHISKRIKGQIVSSENLNLISLLTPAEPHRLGKLFDAELQQPGVPSKKIVARVIEFPKVPSYLLEDLYLEYCYRNEMGYEVLVPLTGIACEPPKLFILMPRYKQSLHQFVYDAAATDEATRKIMKYCCAGTLKIDNWWTT